MKPAFLVLAAALLGVGSLAAQDEHHGPVVYPSTTTSGNPGDLAPDTNSDISPAAGVQNPAPPPTAPASVTVPDASAPVAPSGAVSAPAGPAPTINGMMNQGAPSGGGNGADDDIRDIRPPFFYLKPLTWLWMLLGLLATTALATGLWFWLKPLRARRAKSAYELALEKLEKARALLNEQTAEPYAVLVSETVRTYLGQRFHTPSTRRTTEEFLRQMQLDATTPLAAHCDLLREFLEACDLVKFAHYEPGRDELEQVQRRAVSFVTATKPVEGAPA